jgi:hypothetical protein
MAEVFSAFLGTNRIDLDIHGFDAAGPPGNLNAVRHFDTPNDLRAEIIDARLWAGVHYHFSSVAGVVLGRKVAKFDLKHGFQRSDKQLCRPGRGAVGARPEATASPAVGRLPTGRRAKLNGSLSL